MPTILCENDPCDTTLDSRGSLKKEYPATAMAFAATSVYTPSGQILVQYDCNGYNTDTNSVIVNDKFFYVHDRLGSVRLVLDVNSTVRNSYAYSPYGGMFASECNETVYNPFKFTGQWYDSEIGQYYLRARQYDPVLMRFTSCDPVKGKFQNPLSLHPYLYCLNEPINNTDPNGKISAMEYLRPIYPIVCGLFTAASSHSTAAGIGISIGVGMIEMAPESYRGMQAVLSIEHLVRKLDLLERNTYWPINTNLNWDVLENEYGYLILPGY